MGRATEGRNDQQWIVGGIGSGVSYDFPFRAFAQADSYQMFLDANAMNAIYGTGISESVWVESQLYRDRESVRRGRRWGSRSTDSEAMVAFGMALTPIPEPGTARWER
jgi:hypothetical protein